jgi:hypothetical protein
MVLVRGDMRGFGVIALVSCAAWVSPLSATGCASSGGPGGFVQANGGDDGGGADDAGGAASKDGAPSSDGGPGSTGDGAAGDDGASQDAPASDQETIEIISGNGEVVLSQWPGTDPLLVRVAKGGQPLSGVTVGWSTTNNVHFASGVTSTTTDANGLTSVEVIGEGFSPTTSWISGMVTASAGAAGSVQFVTTTAYPGPQGQDSLNPLVQLNAPPTYDKDLGHVKAGTLVKGAIQALIVAQTGPDTGHGIPNVGVRVTDPQDVQTPATGITCVGGTALSDATGNVSCDLQVGPAAGTYGFTILVGGFDEFGPCSIEVDP